MPLRLPAYSSPGPARSLNTRHRGSLRVWRWQKPKAARELCRATLGRTAGVLRFHSSLEGLTDKGVLCSGNYSEQFYTDAIQPSALDFEQCFALGWSKYFCNNIGTSRTSGDVRLESANWAKELIHVRLAPP
jgi:hypothetical protein